MFYVKERREREKKKGEETKRNRNREKKVDKLISTVRSIDLSIYIYDLNLYVCVCYMLCIIYI